MQKAETNLLSWNPPKQRNRVALLAMQMLLQSQLCWQLGFDEILHLLPLCNSWHRSIETSRSQVAWISFRIRKTEKCGLCDVPRDRVQETRTQELWSLWNKTLEAWNTKAEERNGRTSERNLSCVQHQTWVHKVLQLHGNDETARGIFLFDLPKANETG